MTALYVVHAGRRFMVTGETSIDGAAAFELAPLGKGARIVARSSECREDRRHVQIRGYRSHRDGRPVVMHVHQDKGETRIELRLKGRRKGFEITLEGAFDLAAQSAANVARRERQWKREQRRAGRSA
jgi:hypothetical protein